MPRGTTAGNVRRFGGFDPNLISEMMAGSSRSSGRGRIGSRGSGNDPGSSSGGGDVPFRSGDVYHLTLPQLFYTLGAIQQTVDSITFPDDE